MRAHLLFVFLLLCAAPAGADDPLPCENLTAGPTATVAHVVDGETLRLHDGREVRLAGMLAPRPEDAGALPGKWQSAVAARAELEALALGREVTIHFGGGAREDRYGRHVGHGFVSPAGAGSELIWLQGQMTRLGLARVMTTAQNRACAKELLAIEAEARVSKRGIWAEQAYEVRDANSPDALLALRGTFQIVEGEVTKAEGRRGTLRLEFSGARRMHLRAVIAIPRSGANALAGTTKRPNASSLQGSRVRVRGYVEERGGTAFLDLGIVGDLELLTQPTNARAEP